MGNELIEKLLGLPELNVYDFRQNEHDMGFFVEAKERPTVCLSCGCVGGDMVIYKTRNQTVRDLNVHTKRVALMLKRRYYRCKECNACFAEPIACVDGRITKRLREYIAEKAKTTPFSVIENELQISDTTIRNAFLEEVRGLPSAYELETPSVLGIDEIFLANDNYSRKQAWAVIANGDDNTVMEMLQDRSKASIVEFLSNLKTPKNVDVITMDMWSGYRSAAQETLPNALVVIDKFHVVRMANDVVENYRRSLSRTGPPGLKREKAIFLAREYNLTNKAKEKQNEWFEQYPLLKTAYDLKEEFYDMYECTDRQSAEEYYADWQKKIPKELPGFRGVCRTVNRAYNEIFNYFYAPKTNAFVEGLNSVIRAIAIQGRGYDFEVLRGKVLFTAGRKTVLPDIDFNRMEKVMPLTMDYYFPEIKDYGIPFSAILDAANKGLYKR